MANLNLNVNPYFDDYDETKNFYKILFKPGVALQARELTQIQTILQNQISKIGSYLFKDGTSLTGTDTSTISINYDVRSIKLSTTFNDIAIDPSLFIGKWVVGQTTGILGEVKFTYNEDSPDIGDPPTIVVAVSRFNGVNFFQDGEQLNFYDSRTDALASAVTDLNATVANSQKNYLISSITAYSDEMTVSGSTTSIQIGDYIVYNNVPEDIVVTQIINSNTVLLNKPINFGIFNERVEYNRKSSTHSMILTVDSGTYFKNGTFITVKPQSIVPAKYTAHPTVAVGFRFAQSIVNSNNDTTLLDPALGSSNYFAEGADRLKYDLVLEKIDLINDSTSITQKINVSDTFIELIRFNQGKKDVLVNTSTKSSLRQELAKRTYDESGNYIVVPFDVIPMPSSTANQFKFNLTPGTAYIGGYEVSTISPTTLYLNRALSTDTDLGFNISTSYGNYVIIDAPSNGLLNETIAGSNVILEAHSTENPSSTSTRIGYLGFKHLEYETGTGSNASYRMYSYFFYPDKTNNIPIDNTKSFVLVNNSLNNLGSSINYSSPGFKANVSSLGKDSTGNIKIFENKVDRMIFSIPRNNIKSVSRVSTQYNRTFKNVLFTAGSATISVTSPETFVGAEGALSTSDKRSLFTAVITSASGTLSAGFYPIDDANTTITLSNQSRFATFALADTTFNGTMDIIATIDNDNTTIRTKSLSNIVGDRISITASDVDVKLSKADINQFYRVSRIGSNLFVGAYAANTSYVTNNVVVDSTNGIFYRALQNSFDAPIYDISFWQPLDADSTLSYYLDNGQRDNMYDHGSVRWLPETTAPGNVVVSYNYFEHSGQGPVVADSYPNYDNIGTFTSPLDFTKINLRDSLDFRPRRKDSITNYLAFDEYVKPNPKFLSEADVTYYKPRYDRLYITNQETDTITRGKKFLIQYGIPDLNPSLPPDKTSKDTQLIYNIYVEPYTANIYLNKFERVNINRYTMKNIGNLDKRLIEVERKVKRQGLEIQALNEKITDSNGVELFKTGVFLDDFKDNTKGDISNPNFKATIDTENEEARPPFSAKIIPIETKSLINLVQADRIIQMEKVGEEVALASLNPTNTINANPAGISPGPVIIVKSGTVPGYIGEGVEPPLSATSAKTLLNSFWTNRSGLIRYGASGTSSYPGDNYIENSPYRREVSSASFSSLYSNSSLEVLSNYTTIITTLTGVPGDFTSIVVSTANGPQTLYSVYKSISPGEILYVRYVKVPAKDITSITTNYTQAVINRGTWPCHYIVPGLWGVANRGYVKNAIGFERPLPKDRFRLSIYGESFKGIESLNIYDTVPTRAETKGYWYNFGKNVLSVNLTDSDISARIIGGGYGASDHIVYDAIIAEFYKLPEFISGQVIMPSPVNYDILNTAESLNASADSAAGGDTQSNDNSDPFGIDSPSVQI